MAWLAERQMTTQLMPTTTKVGSRDLVHVLHSQWYLRKMFGVFHQTTWTLESYLGHLEQEVMIATTKMDAKSVAKMFLVIVS